MVLKKVVFLAVVAALAHVAGAVEFTPAGTAKFGNSSLSVRHYHPTWRSSGQPEKEIQGISNAGGSITVPWKLYDGTGAELKETVSVTGENSWKLDYRFSSSQPAETANLSVELKLAVNDVVNTNFYLNGKTFKFKEPQPEEAMIFRGDRISRIEFSMPDGRMLLELPEARYVEVLDCRVWDLNHYLIRISFSRSNGKISESFNSLRWTYFPLRSTPVALDAAANRGFSDETEGDARGGWTDQGPTNDMSPLNKIRKIGKAPLEFPVIDPAANKGNAVVAVGGKLRAGVPESVTVSMKGEKAKGVVLLHGIAWQPASGETAGVITAEFTDGSKQKIPVRSGIDVHDWWNPSSLANGCVAWQGSNKSSEIGLYASFFALQEKPLARLTFSIGNDKTIWMIVSALLVNEKVEFPHRDPVVIKRGKEWRPFECDRSVLKDSALDFSFLQDAPAGKYGFIHAAPDGQFYFENSSKPIRFYGTNICFAALYMQKNECELIAERLARVGYNAVRIHHYDRDIVDRNNTEDSHKIRPDNLDKLDYLIYALKKEGIYISIDLFSARQVVKGEFPGLPECGSNGYNTKALLMISPEMRAKFKVLMKEILTHKNPYTGLSWAEDPAFIGISILNENSIYFLLTGRVNKPVLEYYNAEFDKWAAAKKISVTAENRNLHYHNFLTEVYQNYYREMVQFLKEIGVKAPLTDQNFIQSPNYTALRTQYDYVDNHIYWDHPRPLDNNILGPKQYSNYSVLQGGLLVPRLILPCRVYGIPYTITEFDFPYPNQCRAEGAPIFGAYAALQGWSGIYRFCYSGGARRALDEVSIESFDTANDVTRMLSERLGIAFFLRGDVAESDVLFAAGVPAHDHRSFWNDYPGKLMDLGLYGKVGSVSVREGVCTPAMPGNIKAYFPLTESARLPGLKVPEITGYRDDAALYAKTGLPDGRKDNVYTSSTGELTADLSKRIFIAATPKSEALVLPGGRAAAGKALSAKSKDTFCVAGAIAVDGKELAESRRILLLHLTDLALEGLTFQSGDKRVVTKWPKGQLLAKRGSAEIALAAAPGNWKLYALNASGKRLCEVPFSRKDGKIHFTAATCDFKEDVVFAYELVR